MYGLSPGGADFGREIVRILAEASIRLSPSLIDEYETLLNSTEREERYQMWRSGRVVGEGHRGEVDDDAGATEVDEGDQRVGGVEPEAAVADEADLAVEKRFQKSWDCCRVS